MKSKTSPFFLSACALLVSLVPLNAEDGPKKPIPDLTKGEELSRVNERWLKTIGVFSGAWRPRNNSNELIWVRQHQVRKIEEGSPADGVLKVGDVILGADGTGTGEVPLFQGSEVWPTENIGDAITEAEARDPAILRLRIFRPTKNPLAKDDDKAKAPSLDNLEVDGLETGAGAAGLDDWGPSPNKKKASSNALGQEMTVALELDYLGRYSETAPYNCDKSMKILVRGVEALLKEENVDQAGLAILCILAAAHPDNPQYDRIMAKAKTWAHQLKDGGNPWYVGPKLMALAEYYMKSKDESIFPKLEAMAEHHALGVSWFGTCGHRYSEPRPDGGPNGRIAGYGSINASGVLGFLGLSLAREAGVKSEAVEKSHKAQVAYFGHFGGKSGMGYGEHPYAIGASTTDYNSKTANSGMALALEEDQIEEAKFFGKMSTVTGNERRLYAHGGSFFGQVFMPLGAGMVGPRAANLHFRPIRWHLDLKRGWDYRFNYDCSGGDYSRFDFAAVGLLFYALPLKQLVITGRDRDPRLELSDEEFEAMVKVKNYDHIRKELSFEQLLADIPTASGLLRWYVADELVRRVKEKPPAEEYARMIDELLAMATDPNVNIYGRTGACYSLMLMKRTSRGSLKNAEIGSALVPMLHDEDPYIRFAAVRALQTLGPETLRPYADTIMDAIVAAGRPTFPLDPDDPLQWSHGVMGELLVRNVLKDGIDGVDRDKLIPAIRSLLGTPNGGARSVSTKLLPQLTKEEALMLGDDVLENVIIPPPGNAMFAGGAALNSQRLLGKHNFQEAMALSVDYFPSLAIKAKIPQKFGSAALKMRSARHMMEVAGEQLLVNAVDVQPLIEGMLSGEPPEEMNMLKRIESVTAADPVLKLPATQTQLVAEATNFAFRDPNLTTYTWRKLFGAGKVSFSPNASGDSKTTTVTFTDGKPGKYRFELEMTDVMGLTVARDTVLVTLTDASGKLPPNQAPRATPTMRAAMPGFPAPVTLSGIDPDGDDLGFTVSEMPKHGVLKGVDGRIIEAMTAVDGPITYTADYGYEGTDRLVFLAMDGQGRSAKSTVDFNVSAEKVPVGVYEGFDYPEDGVHDNEGNGSFGFSGPWINSRGHKENYKVRRSALEESGNKASVTYPRLPSRGGRLSGGQHTSVSRLLDTEHLARHGLLEPGGELWFSVFVDGWDIRFWLSAGEDEFGFKLERRQRVILPYFNGEKVEEGNNQSWSRDAKLRFSGGEPFMIVGQFVWGETEEEQDTLNLYRIYNAPVFGPMLVEKPAAVIRRQIDQSNLNAIKINLAEARGIDEIRFGTHLANVMQGTVPMK